MSKTFTDEPFGCQVWLEQDDTPQRVQALFGQAAEAGLGWVRLFLMWNWIEPNPHEQHFSLYDAAFDAATRHGIGIKATLTANSGPWHVGTPTTQHSHTGFLTDQQFEPAGQYIDACVKRYAHHASLGQWILWNEPMEPGYGGDAYLGFWQRWLRQSYSDRIEELNNNWRTGLDSFDSIPQVHDLSHHAHRRSHWRHYAPFVDELRCRRDWLTFQLAWIAARVRQNDPDTPLCINPTAIHANQAAMGTDLRSLASVVSTLGASFHPTWHFAFANRDDFPALIAAGVRHLGTTLGVDQVEVTELQSGNTYESSLRPCNVTPSELQRFYLAGLAGGASTVTGWLLNARSHDFESGEWGLLDDLDQASPRSRAVRQLRDRLRMVRDTTGPWRPMRPNVWVVRSRDSDIRDAVRQHLSPSSVPGRDGEHPSQASAYIAIAAMCLGHAACIVDIDDLGTSPQPGDTIILTHVGCVSAKQSDVILNFARQGCTVLIDACTGRYAPPATLHRPWPIGWYDAAGLYAAGLDTSHDGYMLCDDYQRPAGRAVVTRTHYNVDDSWVPAKGLRFTDTGEPVGLERTFDSGRLIACRILLGDSMVHSRESMPHLQAWLSSFLSSNKTARNPAIIAGHPSAITLPVDAANGQLSVVLSPDLQSREGRSLRYTSHALSRTLTLQDLWTGNIIHSDPYGEFELPASDGIALLWHPKQALL